MRSFLIPHHAGKRVRLCLICTRIVNSFKRYHVNGILSTNERSIKRMPITKYYLGLDMGTNSVGWAVTDANYKILRAKGKDMWGIREYDEASPAVERRTNRISRRRNMRSKARIGLLNDYFADEIAKVDSGFLQRLANSKYHLEDKDEAVRCKYAIFNDKDYTDRDYFKEYPTIFHLRSELIHNNEPHDVRLVYLALLNMFKHRGHFLANGIDTTNEVRNIAEVYSDFISLANDICELDFPEDNVDFEEFKKILADRKLSRSQKVDKLSKILDAGKKEKDFIKAMCGLKIDANKIFSLGIEDKSVKTSFAFSDSSYDENEPELLGMVGEEYSDIILSLKEIYNIGTLEIIMRGSSYLSDARIKDYDQHHEDLKILKRVIKKYSSKDYHKMFRSDEPGSYAAYVNSTNSGKKIRRARQQLKNGSSEILYKTILNILKAVPDDDKDVKYIKEQIERENFLPKQLTASNGVIPNQVHEREMRKILDNASAYLPFLKQIGDSRRPIAEEIVDIFTFTIPYYVGPTSEKSQEYGGNGWVIRKEGGKILPWNISDKIDMDKTNEAFISKMVRRCTYISGEMVLPKSSLLYEKYCVLNEINNIRIDGERISPELKQDIYAELYESGKRVTRNKLEKYLVSRGVITEGVQITGIDENLNNYLSSYGKMKGIFEDHIREDKYWDICEKIIFLATVYGDNKRFLRSRLKKEIPELKDKQIRKVLGFKFSDWSKLSEKFLHLRACDKSTGEEITLIDAMWNSSKNMMELINSDEYTFKDELENLQTSSFNSLSEFYYKDLDGYYFSAPVKRMVWQAIKIVKEIEMIMGCAPAKLFVEMTRSEGEKKRITTRKAKFLDLYKNVKDELHDWNEIINNADSDGRLRSKKMYLYLTQQGRCMYTGRQIELDKLFDDNLYDIDHIYPRHFVKDDNIDNNLVLVEKEKNAHKSDNYPIEDAIYRSQISMWSDLCERGFISKTKFSRLISRQAFTDEQKAGFIARQLVETSQATKGVNTILKELLKGQTTIVYSKASNVAEFRKNFNLLKCRLVNDFHHAADAYLNIVVGNVYYTKFTQNPIRFIKDEYNKDSSTFNYHLSNMYKYDVVRNGEVAWVADDGESKGTISVIKSQLSKNTPILSRMTYENHGGITRKQTVWSSKVAKQNVYFPMKTSDERLRNVAKYGGMSDVATAYFFLVEHDVKKKRVRTLETVPVYLSKQIEKDGAVLKRYCIDDLGLINPDIRMRKINIQSLVKKDGYFLNISGTTENRITMRNCVGMCLGQKWNNYIKKIEKYIDQKVLDEKISSGMNNELYDEILAKHTVSIFRYRPNPSAEMLKKGKERFIKLDIENQISVLYQMLLLTAIGLGKADLTLIGGSRSSGLMLMSKTISSFDEVLLISQSVTGLLEKRIDLLTV